MKVLLLNNVPAPYFSPLFNELARVPNWQLTICYTSNWISTVGWRSDEPISASPCRTIVLDRIKPRLSRFVGGPLSAAYALMALLNKERPDYLICYGYTLKPQVTLICWAMLTATRFALIGDANYFCDQPGWLKGIAKKKWLRFVVKKASALIAIGTASKLFWQKYGALPSQIFKSLLVVDNKFFLAAAKEKAAQSLQLRSQLGLDSKVVFLFVGRLIKRKNVDLVIQAASRLGTSEFAVVIAGAGEDSVRLKSLAGNNPDIVFVGNVTPQEVPAFYNMADVLVLPAGQEPWGLVINEAMVCGLAIIAHRHCGAAVDLVDADNGIKLQGFSVEELAEAMQMLVRDRSLLRNMQENSRLKIQDWSIEKAAEGIVEAVRSTCQK